VKRYMGYIACYSWCVIAAFSKLVTSDVGQRLGPFIVSFFVFSLTSLLVIVYNTLHLRKIWHTIKENRLFNLTFALNISSFVNWGLVIYPLTYLQPALVVTLVLGVNPVATMAINRLFLNKTSPAELVWSGLALSFVFLFLGFYTLNGKNSIQDASHVQVVLSLLFCYMSGIATSVNNVLTKKIMDHGLGAIDMLCVRFHLTIIISGLIGFSTGQVVLNQNLVVSIAWTALVFVMAPLLLLQIALKRLDPLRVSMISPLMPVLVVLMQIYTDTSTLPYATIIAVVCTWLIVLCGSVWSARKSC